MHAGDIASIPGISVGHYTDESAATGCTVVLCEQGAVGGVDVRGSAPGTRETDLLRPTAWAPEVHAVLLSGGSAFGLDAASGVVGYLERMGVGVRVGPAVVPIVPAAILFDLSVITHETRPGPNEGLEACRNAGAGATAEGNVGAGTGATVAKLLGLERAVKSGVGTASVDLGRGLLVGAIAAVNALGGVHDPESGSLIAGPRTGDGSSMHDPLELITSPQYPDMRQAVMANTTIGVVATNATMTKAEANKMASVAHDGLALAVRPAHLTGDGDTIFALATGEQDGPDDLNRVYAAAVVAMSRAIARGVLLATSLGGIPSVAELKARADD